MIYWEAAVNLFLKLEILQNVKDGDLKVLFLARDTVLLLIPAHHIFQILTPKIKSQVLR